MDIDNAPYTGFHAMLDIIELIETGGELEPLYAVGDNGTAFGCLQIRQGALTDVNKAKGTRHKLQDMLGNRALCRWVFWEYMKLYAREDRLGRKPTMLDMARIWNGGPNGYKKASTLPYAEKFLKILKEAGGSIPEHA